MTLKPPTGTTDAVTRAVAEIRGMGPSRPDMMTGTQIKNGVPTSDRTRELMARPTCAVCDKPVESFTETDEVFMGRVTFVARCHGATQKVRVDREVIASQVGKIQFGLAFVPENRLAAPPAPRLLGPKDEP